MTSRRRLLPPPPVAFDVDATLEDMRDQLRRTNAMLVVVAEKLEDLWRDDAAPEVTRWRDHIPYLLEAAQRAVSEAMQAGDQLDRHRRNLRGDR